MQRKILIITIGYIIGIIWGLYFNISIAFILPLICLIIKLIYTIDTSKLKTLRYIKLIINKKTIILICIASLVSNTIVLTLNNRYDNLYKNLEQVNIIGIVMSSPEQGQYSNTYKLKVESINNSQKYKATQLYIKVDLNENLEYGTKIKAQGEFIEPNDSRNYKGYSYKDYLKSIKIYGTVKIDSNIEILAKNCNNKINTFIYNLSNLFQENINDVAKQENEKSILLGILLGNKDLIPEDIEQNFRDSGLSHVLAISGLHISYITIGITSLIKKLKIGKKIGNIFCILILLIYMAMVGFSPSVVRATTMAILLICADMLYKKSDIITNISLSALIILISNPFNIQNIGMLLSFGGTIGIIVFSQNITKILDKIIKTDNIKNSVIIKTLIIVKELLSVTIAAQIVIFPIIVLVFGTISLTFFISNLLTSHLIGFIIILGIITIFINIAIPNLSYVFSLILTYSLSLLIKITEICAQIPLSKIYVVSPNLIYIILYYILIFVLNYCYLIKNNHNKTKTQTRFINFIKYKINYKKILIIIIIVNIFIYSINAINRGLNIYFIDVGQGDSTLIVTENNKKILIDGGGSLNQEEFDVGESILVPYLLKRGIRTLDYVLISHFDADYSMTYPKNA